MIKAQVFAAAGTTHQARMVHWFQHHIRVLDAKLFSEAFAVPFGTRNNAYWQSIRIRDFMQNVKAVPLWQMCVEENYIGRGCIDVLASLQQKIQSLLSVAYRGQSAPYAGVLKDIFEPEAIGSVIFNHQYFRLFLVISFGHVMM
jgi:hypothetical protein